MLRSGGLLRAMLGRARADWRVLLGASLLVLAAITLVTATSLYGDAVALAGLRRTVAEAPPADQTVLVRTNAFPADLGHVDGVVRPEVARALAAAGAEIALVVRSDPFGPAEAPDDGAAATVLATFEGIERHAALVAGSWAAASPGTGAPSAIEATLSEGAARTFGVSVGDRLRVANRLEAADPVEVAIVGIWRPDAADPYWLASGLEIDGVASTSDYAARGPLVVAAADLARPGLTRNVALEWRAIPAADGMRVERIGALRAGIHDLANRLRPIVGPGRSVAALSGLPDLLAVIDRSILVSRAAIALLTVQFAVLAAYAILLVAGMLAERRRPETALLRSRGATGGHLLALAATEAVLLAGPGVVLAPALGAAVVAAFAPPGGAGVGPESGIAIALIAGLAAVVVLTLPTAASGLSPARVRAALARPLGRTFGQRLGVDVVLVVLAVIALWQLRLYGAPITRDVQGSFGLDPLLVAAPAIGLLAGAVLAVRIVPRLAELGERVLERRHDLLPPLGARQVARRPLRYTPTALLLLLAAALGTFAAAYDATWVRSQGDQAAYQAAGDLRLSVGTGAGFRGWQHGPALRALPGVRDATAVGRSVMSVGTAIREAELLAVDAVGAAPVLADAPGLEGGPAPGEVLAPLAARRRPTPGLALPAGTRRVAVVLAPDLAATFGTTVQPGFVSASLVVAGPDGLARLVASEPVPFGAGGRAVVPFSATSGSSRVTLAGTLHLVGIELAISAQAPSDVTGTLAVRGLEVSLADDDGGGAWQPLAFAPGPDGWSWERVASPAFRPVPPLDGDTATIGVGPPRAGSPSGLGGVSFPSPDQPPVTARLSVRAALGGAIAAIPNDAFLEEAGARVGETIRISVGGESVSVLLLPPAPSFPPLDPDAPFLLADSLPLQFARYASSATVTPPWEWWIDADDEAVATISAAALEAPISASSAVSRDGLAGRLATDVVPLGVIGALVIGALAAAIVAGIGFLMSATASITERLGEFALLRALGVSGRSISRWLVVEQGVLLAFGLVIGTGLGVVLAWLVLPFASLTANGEAPVPPPVVVIPWLAIAPVWLGAAALLAVAAAILARRIPGLSLSGLLRTRDG